MKKFRGFVRGVGKQQLLLVAAVILLIVITRVVSNSNPLVADSAVVNHKKIARTQVLGDKYSKNSVQHQDKSDHAQGDPTPGASSSTYQQPDPTTTHPAAGPVTPSPINPPIIVLPSTPQPIPAPQPEPCPYQLNNINDSPICYQPPCTYCSPSFKKACPMNESNYVIYPCGHCGGPVQTTDVVCPLYEGQ